MSEGSNRKFKYLRILMFSVGLSLLVFSFLPRQQSLLFFSDFKISNSTKLANTRDVAGGSDMAKASDPQKSVDVTTGRNPFRKGDFEARSTPAVKISGDSLTVRVNTSRSLPGGAVLAESESSSVNKQELEWEQTILKRFSERQSLLKEKCKSYEGSIPMSVTRLLSDAFLYSRKYNLLTCITAKGGASTWKTHFLKMSGYAKYIGSPHQSSLKKRIIAEKMHQENEEEKIVRVMSVRHPFSRLVSAYMDKFANGSLRAPTKLKMKMYRPVLTLMGRPIIHNLRVAVPFSIFLRAIIEENKRGTVGMGRHWRPYSSNCRPCRIPYDYIVKLETFEDDLRYIVLKLGIEEINVSTQRNKASKKTSPIYESYFRDIPDDIIARVYSIYKQDFYLFDYDVPQFVKDALTSMDSKQKLV
ncbi:carbohydrate sulfotransferase 11-like isoform X2 [Palaemon carinicauda]|uniref:carbohydrate sulfotransferase 11-like isoform X2 n=1 Tax=Palaemon carinicauda TaxID=392227 RepID=UPI0035B62EB3